MGTAVFFRTHATGLLLEIVVNGVFFFFYFPLFLHSRSHFSHLFLFLVLPLFSSPFFNSPAISSFFFFFFPPATGVRATPDGTVRALCLLIWRRWERSLVSTHARLPEVPVSFDQVEAVPLQLDGLRVLRQLEYFSIAVEYERKVIGSSNELQGRLPFVCLGA